MKPSDLMLKDWLWFDKTLDQVQEISYIQGKGYHVSFAASATLFPVPIEKIRPVPLTPDILQSNGFVLLNDNSYSISYRCILDKIKQNHIIIFFTKDTQDIDVAYYENDDYKSIDDLPIKYVHELQHFYKILGINKEIIL